MNSTELTAVVGAVTGTLGALTGIVALAWQIRGQRASGRVISVRSLFLIPIVGDLAKAPGRPDSPQVAVRVMNRGGQPVTVLNYGVSMGRSKTANLIVLSPYVTATKLPAVVDPGGQPVEVMIPVEALAQAHKDHGVPYRRMRAWVDLGDGRRVKSENPIPLGEGW